MEDDMWRADGSFRGIQAGGGGGGKSGGGGGGKSGGGPQFNRVIPKFLQKFHQGPVGPAINTKFQPAPQPPGEEDGDDDELDDVQKAAIGEYLKTYQEKKDAVAKAAGADEEDGERNKEQEEKKRKTQRVAALGSSDANDKDGAKKRKRKDVKTLSNKKLLSFSMDDEDA